MSTTLSETQVQAGKKWIEEFYLSLDKLDLRNFLETKLEPDVVLNFANLSPVKGYEGVTSIFGPLMDGLTNLEHELKDVYVLPDRILASSSGLFETIGHAKVEVKAIAILHKGLEDDKAHQYDLYADFTPLYQALASLQAKTA